MVYEYSAQNHDWDLTLSAARQLLGLGPILKRPTTGTLEINTFSCFTASMLLSFCAIESFSASLAFLMPNSERFKDFDFNGYRKSGRFWKKVELLCEAIPYEIDKSQGLFQTIGEMQDWRNLVTHASPYEVAKTVIANPVAETGKLHLPFRQREYTHRVTHENAQKFYSTACSYIQLMESLTGLAPRAGVSYKVGK